MLELRNNGKIEQAIHACIEWKYLQVAKIPTLKAPRRLRLYMGFGKNKEDANENTFRAIEKGFEQCHFRVRKQAGPTTSRTLPKVDPKYQAQFNMAAMVLKGRRTRQFAGRMWLV